MVVREVPRLSFVLLISGTRLLADHLTAGLIFSTQTQTKRNSNGGTVGLFPVLGSHSVALLELLPGATRTRIITPNILPISRSSVLRRVQRTDSTSSRNDRLS